MFNLNINWLKIIKEQLPFFLQTTRRIDWILALISPINKIYQEFLVQHQVYIYKIGFNGEVMYLETILNDKFDPINRTIYITDGLPFSPVYLYKKSEAKPPKYLHRRWKQTINYTIGQIVIHENKIYKALSNNIHNQPASNPLVWQYLRDIEYWRTRSEYLIQFNFIVNVPTSLVYDLNAMKALLDFYRLAGCRYKIVTF